MSHRMFDVMGVRRPCRIGKKARWDTFGRRTHKRRACLPDGRGTMKLSELTQQHLDAVEAFETDDQARE